VCISQLSSPPLSTYAEPMPNQSQKTMVIIIKTRAVERCHVYRTLVMFAFLLTVT
jgi:hypothetical protein